ncbi:MAG: flagellar biosynthesis anti-sigma factor FlgM [Syntrophobacteraceae bacterium]
MEIKNIAAYSSHTVNKPQEQGQRLATDEKASGKDVPIESDRVKLSSGYQEMAQVKKVIMERGDIRTERVDQVRSMVNGNTYTVEPEKIAKKMLEELW